MNLGHVATFTLHVDLVAGFKNDEQCESGEEDETNGNFPHDDVLDSMK